MSGALLTFVVPVRHPANALDWTEHMHRFAQTVRSISAQADDRWRAVVVANRGALLPPLPPRFSVERVDFPPNKHFPPRTDPEEIYDAIRLDKGRRVLAGLLATRPTGHVMVTDDDDLVNRGLVGFVARHAGENGWYVDDGYVWTDGGRFVYRCAEFSHVCGTSLIVRADLLALPPDAAGASDSYIKHMLGSHVFIEKHLAEAGTPLARLPFRGAVYRIGHRGASSRSSGLRGHFFYGRLLFRPKTLLERLLRLRPLSPGVRHEFFGV
jgi:hypothetical protein